MAKRADTNTMINPMFTERMQFLGFLILLSTIESSTSAFQVSNLDFEK